MCVEVCFLVLHEGLIIFYVIYLFIFNLYQVAYLQLAIFFKVDQCIVLSFFLNKNKINKLIHVTEEENKYFCLSV